MITETAEKIALLFYELWTTRGIITDETITLVARDNETEFDCDDDALHDALSKIVDGNFVLLKNALTFMIDSDIISVTTSRTINGALVMLNIIPSPKAIKMIEAAQSKDKGNREYQEQYNNTFGVNVNFSLIHGSLVENKLSDSILRLFGK